MLKLDNSRERSIFTLGGMLTYSRYYMRPIDDENKNRMVELCGQSGIAPLDEYLGLANLPFLISCEAAIQICRIALETSSYEAAALEVHRRLRFKISDDNVRKIVVYIGSIVALHQISDIEQEYDPDTILIGKRRGRPAKDTFILYMEISHSGSDTFVCCAYTVSEHSTSSRNLAYHKGSIDGLRSILVSQALAHGLRDAKEMIILFDGTADIRDLCIQLFPFARMILNMRHLSNYMKSVSKQLTKRQVNPGYRADYFYRHAMKHIEEGQAEKIFMMNEITSVKSNAGKKAEIKNLQKYLEANKEGIRYPDFVEKGYLIGSDLPKNEEKLFEEGKLQTSGSMWKPEYAAAYLPLYARYVSGEWHSYIVPLIRKFYNGNTKLVDDQVSNG